MAKERRRTSRKGAGANRTLVWLGAAVLLAAVGDVAKKLAEATDRVLLFVDACRAHRDEAKQLTSALEVGLQQDVTNMSDLIAAIQFASGIYGPHPMFFASEDGVAAPTIRLPEKGLAAGTGPLAAVLGNVADEVAANGGSLDLTRLAEQLARPRRLGTPAADVRGYTFLRDRERDEFPKVPLIASEPLEVARRTEPFRPPYEGFTSRLNDPLPASRSPSNARAIAVAELADDHIQAVASEPDGRAIWILDERERVFAVGRGGRLTRINDDLPLMGIVWDRRFGLVGAQWDIPAFFSYRNGRWQELRQGVRPQFLVASGSDELVAVSGHDEYTCTVLGRDGFRESRRFVSREFLDVAAAADGALWVVEAGAVRRLAAGAAAVRQPMWKPTLAAARGSVVYLLSEEGRVLYRLDGTAGVERVDLFDAGLGDGYVRAYGQRAFRMLANGDALVGVGRVLVRIDLQQANWQRVARS